MSLTTVLKQGRFTDLTDFQSLKTFLIKRLKHSSGRTAKFCFCICKQKEKIDIDDYVSELYELALVAFFDDSNNLIDQAILEQLFNEI